VDVIFERIAAGVSSAADVRYVHDHLTWLSPPDQLRVDERCVAVDREDGVRVGDRFYYGLDAVRIRAVIVDVPGTDPPSASAGAAGELVFGGGLAAVTAGLAILATALVSQWAPLVAGEWESVPQGPFELVVALLAVGALTMRIGAVLRTPHGC